MKKIVLAYSSFLVCGIALAYQVHTRISRSSIVACNIEALSQSPDITETTGTYYCKGNTSTCAKGRDESTGKEFIIHGKPSKIK